MEKSRWLKSREPKSRENHLFIVANSTYHRRRFKLVLALPVLRQNHFVFHRGVVFLVLFFQHSFLTEDFFVHIGMQWNGLPVLLVNVRVPLEGELITETSRANVALVRLDS